MLSPLYSRAARRCALPAAGVLLAALACPALADEAPSGDTPSYTLTANLTLASEYRYRGLMQTAGNPAIQGGFDFSHASGFYLGNWNSNISWLSDGNGKVSAPIEMDFYGGYKGKITDDVPFDLGVLRYQYPGDYPSGVVSPDTTELYAGTGYGPVTFKYSYAPTNLFGFDHSQHSQYADLTANFDTGVWGLTVNTHVGYQYVRNVDHGSYWDWKLGLTKDFGQGWSASVAYIDTNADRTVYTNPQGRYIGRATGLASVTKTF
ncbi:MAG TPA: TorF family putative porin [Bordetella sp.]